MLERLVITRYHKILFAGKTLCKCVGVCVCIRVSICVCLCVYMCIIKDNYIDLLFYRYQKKNKWTQIKKSVHSGGRWTLISSAGEPEQKWLYLNPQNSHSGHQLMSPTTAVTIYLISIGVLSFKMLNWIFQILLALHLLIEKPLYMHWLAFFSGINK